MGLQLVDVCLTVSLSQQVGPTSFCSPHVVRVPTVPSKYKMDSRGYDCVVCYTLITCFISKKLQDTYLEILRLVQLPYNTQFNARTSFTKKNNTLISTMISTDPNTTIITYLSLAFCSIATKRKSKSTKFLDFLIKIFSQNNIKSFLISIQEGHTSELAKGTIHVQ